jgi:hypothetical protein
VRSLSFQKVRHEFLAVLQALVVAFSDERDFVGLSGLRDTDIDADFFENIRSIQVCCVCERKNKMGSNSHNSQWTKTFLYSFLLCVCANACENEMARGLGVDKKLVGSCRGPTEDSYFSYQLCILFFPDTADSFSLRFFELSMSK